MQPDSDRVELSWPGKTSPSRLVQTADGKWDLHDEHWRASLRGLKNVQRFGSADGAGNSLFLVGQRHDALRFLRHSMGPVFRFIYCDLPRLNVDESATAFQTASPRRLTVWLSFVRSLLLESRELLNRKGVVAVHCGEDESQYARILLDELFRDRRVGTIVWQKTYSAKNMKGMKEFTDSHDLIYVYARDKESLPAVGLRRAPRGYSNHDNDPRQAWKAEHKGAKTRRANSDFDTYQPPYRWSLVDGELPPGLWRVSPFTGVIWGVPSQAGDYEFEVEVADQRGVTARSKFRIRVAHAGEPAPPADIPWIFEEVMGGGPLSITTTELPVAVMSKEYSTVLFAKGGTPFRGPPIRPGSGRYWDFAKNTLIAAYQADAVYLGRPEPTAIPTPKKYLPSSGVEIENQQSIWLGRSKANKSSASEVLAGFTEDATKHLKALKSLGLIETEVSTAKPEPLLEKLVKIFTDEGDLTLEPMSGSGDLSAVALKTGRRFVALQGGSERDLQVAKSCALPRLRAVIEGEDRDLESRAVDIKVPEGAYVPFKGGGNFIAADLGPEIAAMVEGDDYASFTDEAFELDDGQLACAILTSEGFIPTEESQNCGTSMSSGGRAIVIPSSQYLTPEIASALASDESSGAESTTLYYFRATEDLREPEFGGRVRFRRVPFDLLHRDVI